MMLVECVILAELLVYQKEFYILTGLLICMLPPLCHPMQEIIVIDTILLVVPQFHVMAWGFPFMSAVWIKHGATLF
jgi:hypothetical protein